MSQEITPSETRAEIVDCIVFAILLLSYVGAAIWIGSRAGWGWTAALLLIAAAMWFAARQILRHGQPSMASQPEDELDASLRAMLEQTESDPDARAALEAMQRQMEENPLLQAIQALIETQSPADVLSAMQTHPILLSDEADEMLRRFIENARQMGEAKMAHLVEERYQILRQIRELGVAPEELVVMDAPDEASPPEL